MKCHYEVLNVQRDADEGEIKLAYKKLALRWHPDKNLDDIENATEQFQLVQQAYEVLSDRQERAWYDNHREQILRGSNSDFKDDNLDVFQYFTTTCFKGYNDDDDGFYAVYRAIFEKIAKEDVDYMDCKEDFCNIPMFGNSTSDFDETVAPFYNFWLSYTTKKSYVWLDPYNIREATNRRVSKLIDKENDKIRQKAKKERNEEVRSLVAFVRKRDKRVQAHSKLLEARKLENRQKQEKFAKQKRLERIKQLNESGEQAEWMKFENVKSELEEIERKLAEEFGDEISNSEQSSNSEDEFDHLYCVACNKIFKNPKAFENHESSKKHKENVGRLKENMIDEDEEFEDMIDEHDDEEFQVNSSNSETFNDFSDQNVIDNQQLPDREAQSFPVGKETKCKKKNKKSRNLIQTNNSREDVHVEAESDVADNKQSVEVGEDVHSLTKRKQKRKEKKEKSVDSTFSTNVDDTESNMSNNVKVESDCDTTLKNKNKKKDRRRNKKSNVEAAEVDVNQCCAVCKADFQSKNKLFDHLKKTGHSVYIPSCSSSKAERKMKTLVKEK